MSRPGIGAMLHALSGGSEQDPAKYYGRVIKAAQFTETELALEFMDGTTIKIFDDGQSCCESRYMRTDDDVASLVGNELRRIEAKDGPTVEMDYGVHEQVFIEVGTDKGFIIIASHNEHNGYYGGFGLSVAEVGR